MISSFAYEIERNPEPEDVGTIKVNVNTTKIYQSIIDGNLCEELVESPSIQASLSEGFEGLTELLRGSGEITPVDVDDALLDLFLFVVEVTSYDDYTPDCALIVWMTLTIVVSLPEQIDEEILGLFDERDVFFASDHQVEDFVLVPLNETIEEEVTGSEDEHDIVFELDDHQIEEAAPPERLREVFRISVSETTEEEVQSLEDDHGLFVYEAAAPSQPVRVFSFQDLIRPSQTEEVFRFQNLIQVLDEDNVSSGFAHQTEEVVRSQIEEVFRVSFNESNTVRLRPASKHAVGSLKRKIYKKTSDVVGEIMCTICLEEFNEGRSIIVTLPCGHEFDEECVVEWLMSSHVCPLCRFKLPCKR